MGEPSNREVNSAYLQTAEARLRTLNDALAKGQKEPLPNEALLQVAKKTLEEEIAIRKRLDAAYDNTDRAAGDPVGDATKDLANLRKSQPLLYARRQAKVAVPCYLCGTGKPCVMLTEGNQKYEQAILDAAQKTGLSPEVIASIIDSEAGPGQYEWNPKPNGDHVGLAQFSSSTWTEQATKYDTALRAEAIARGYVKKDKKGRWMVDEDKRKDLLALRDDGNTSIMAAAEYMRQIYDDLVKRGAIAAGETGDDTAWKLWACHNLGAGDSRRFFGPVMDGDKEYYAKRLAQQYYKKPKKTGDPLIDQAREEEARKKSREQADAEIKANGNDAKDTYKKFLQKKVDVSKFRC